MKRYCYKCGEEHELAYVFHSNSTKHLILLHKTLKGKRSDVYLPYEDNLDIPTIETKKQHRKFMATAPKEPEVAGQISLVT